MLTSREGVAPMLNALAGPEYAFPSTPFLTEG
jgi:hypothetical protein